MNFLQRLFSQPKTKTTTFVNEQEGALESTNPTKANDLGSLPPGLHIGKLSDVGRERERNEDSFFMVEALIQHDLGAEPFGLFIVADGMGGHQSGEVASSLAARITANTILQEIYLPYLTNNQNANNRPLNETLVAAVQDANTAVQEEVPDGGTTLTAALVMGNNAYIAHIGDSRAYIIKQDEIKQITEDHSLAQRLEDLGQASAEEIAQVQNVLYRAIGQGSTVDVDTYIQHLPAGASLLLCSDGLWGQVTEEELKEVFTSASTPQNACEQLIALANENGGPDNITTIIISMGNDEDSEP